MRTFDRAPQDAVEDVVGALVWLLKRQARGDVGVLAQLAVGNSFGLGIHLVERDVVGHGVEGREVRRDR